MKHFFALVFVMLTSTAFAGEKYICREINAADEYSPRKMILTQVGDETIREGTFVAFKLEIFQGNSSKPLFSEAVNVRTEDVMFKISNTAKKISGIIFMDEPDQSHLTIGKTEMSFDCN